MMLTFRRAILIALTGLGLFFFFFGPTRNMHPRELLRDQSLEQKLVKTKEETVAALTELQKSTVEKAKEHERRLEILDAERKLLEKELQQLRRLPADASLRSQLAFQFPYDSGAKFPAIVWQTWKHDLDDPNLDPHIQNTIRSWQEKNPGFVHEVVSDQTAHALIRHLYMNVPKVIEAYEAMPEPVLKADFFRYLILLARGGTYSDVDTVALQPIPNWIPSNVDPIRIGLIVGIEADPDREDWADWYARRLQFCQWTIQAKPGHPALRDIVTKVTEETLKRKKNGKLKPGSIDSRGTDIMEWTGPGAWSDSVFAYFNDNLKSGLHEKIDYRTFTGMTEPRPVSDVLVLPITSFSPGTGTMGSEAETHPLAFVKHNFEGSWKPEDERVVGN